MVGNQPFYGHRMEVSWVMKFKQQQSSGFKSNCDKGTQNRTKDFWKAILYTACPYETACDTCVYVLKNTYSFQNPLTDVEYADDTQDTLSRLHLRQHLAARIGLLYGPKCQLLCIHDSLPISLSTIRTHFFRLWLPLLCSLFPVNSKPLPLPQFQTSTIAASQASSAKTLDPSDILLYHLNSNLESTHRSFKFVQSILLHGSKSQIYSPAQIARIDSLHYKALQQIFLVKSPYHRIL